MQCTKMMNSKKIVPLLLRTWVLRLSRRKPITKALNLDSGFRLLGPRPLGAGGREWPQQVFLAFFESDNHYPVAFRFILTYNL
ncbi:MAG: hypothetical protein C0407_02010 [Desulfobacca sp.]|nr:hypothetical protein [Desulfobacca sp.]